MEDIINVTISRQAYRRLLKLEEKMKKVKDNFTLESYGCMDDRFKVHSDNKIVKKFQKVNKKLRKRNWNLNRELIDGKLKPNTVAKELRDKISEFKKAVWALRKTSTQEEVVGLMGDLC